jgi:hypothetical protein
MQGAAATGQTHRPLPTRVATSNCCSADMRCLRGYRWDWLGDKVLFDRVDEGDRPMLCMILCFGATAGAV